MKTKYLKLAILPFILAATVLLPAGCSTAPPTKVEQGLFDILTNQVVITKTNEVVVPVYQTNVITELVTRTNIVNGEPVVNTVTVTNEHRIVTWQTNMVTQAVTNEAYAYTPGPGAKEITDTAASVGNLFGVGGIVGTGLTFLWGLWASLRSNKRYLTAANTVQVVETLREFIKTLPNGEAYDTALTQWMQVHQAEAGVTQQVIDLLAKEMNNPDAKVAAEQIKAVIQSLSSATAQP